MPVKVLPEIINLYKQEWVSLTHDDKFVSHGKTPVDCIDEAMRQGFTLNDITLLYVPDEWPMIHGSSIFFR